MRKLRAAAELLPRSASAAVAGIGPDTPWDFRGPRNLSGVTYCLLPDSENASLLFSGSHEGLWRSDDAGDTWRAVAELDGLAVLALVGDPRNHDIIFAATGFEGAGSNGIYKTEDRGLTWRRLQNSPVSPTIRSIAISPDDSSVVLAGTSSGVFRSADAGESWSQVVSQGVNAMVAFAPADGSLAIVGIRDEGVRGGRGRVLRSFDGGRTFEEASGFSAPDSYSVAVAYAPSLPNRVYASNAALSFSSLRLWRSDDGGRTFTATSGFPDLFGYHIRNTLFVSPVDADLVIYGGIEGFLSTDGARSFQYLPTSGGSITVPHTDYLAVIADPAFNSSTNRRVYVCTDGGVYVNDNLLTSNWRPLSRGHASTQFYSIDVSRRGAIVGGMQDTGVAVIKPDSEDAEHLFDADVVAVMFDPMSDQRCFVSTFGKISLTCGSAFGTVTDIGFDSSRWNTPFAAAPSDPTRLFAASMTIVRIDNVQTNHNVTPIRLSDGKTHFSAIAVDPSNVDVAWVVADDGTVYRTTNATSGTPQWTAVFTSTATLSAALPSSIVIDRHDARTVYVGSNHGILKSSDDGGTWESIFGTVPVQGLIEHPTVHGWLYAATPIGLFTSADGGQLWSARAAVVPINLDIRDLLFQPGSETLYVATFGRGVWSVDIPANSLRRRAVHH